MGTIRPQMPKGKKDPKNDPLQSITTADKIKTLGALVSHLCAMPIRPNGRVDAEECRACESQCAYGRKLVDWWDEALLNGEDPMQAMKKRGRPRKPLQGPYGQNGEKAKTLKQPTEDDSMAIAKKSCDEVTLQEQLEAKLAENKELRETVESLVARNNALIKEVESLKACMELAEAKQQEERAALIGLKARMLDLLHPELMAP